jgi:hypothetical protein
MIEGLKMAKSGIEFKVRVWSKTAERPFDVVALDHDNNRQHYQPGVEFSTERLAHLHADRLTCNLTAVPSSSKFIRDHWPVDGGIE